MAICVQVLICLKIKIHLKITLGPLRNVFINIFFRMFIKGIRIALAFFQAHFSCFKFQVSLFNIGFLSKLHFKLLLKQVDHPERWATKQSWQAGIVRSFCVFITKRDDRNRIWAIVVSLLLRWEMLKWNFLVKSEL